MCYKYAVSVRLPERATMAPLLIVLASVPDLPPPVDGAMIAGLAFSYDISEDEVLLVDA